MFIPHEGGYPCHRIPSVLLVSDGELLAFAEARLWTGDGCYAHGNYPSYDDPNRRTDIAMKRSVDGGATWTNFTIIHTFASQPTPVWDAVRKAIVLQFSAAAWVFAMTSHDNGQTWAAAVNVSAALGKSFPPAVAVGPGVGIQLREDNPYAPGRILWIGHHLPYTMDFVWYTDDGGKTYSLSSKANLTQMDEAQLVELPDGRVMANMRNHHLNTTCKCRAFAISNDGGATFGKVGYDPALISPICMATILRGRGDEIFFANPATTSGRDNGMIRRSDDSARTWPRQLQVGNPYAYSCLTLTASTDTHGLLWETWGGPWSDDDLCDGEACSCVFSRFPADLHNATVA